MSSKYLSPVELLCLQSIRPDDILRYHWELLAGLPEPRRDAAHGRSAQSWRKLIASQLLLTTSFVATVNKKHTRYQVRSARIPCDEWHILSYKILLWLAIRGLGVILGSPNTNVRCASGSNATLTPSDSSRIHHNSDQIIAARRLRRHGS